MLDTARRSDARPAKAAAPSQLDLEWNYRNAIAEWLATARVYADLGVKYAEIGDDAGLAHALASQTAHLKAAYGTFADLKALKVSARQAAARG